MLRRLNDPYERRNRNIGHLRRRFPSACRGKGCCGAGSAVVALRRALGRAAAQRRGDGKRPGQNVDQGPDDWPAQLGRRPKLSQRIDHTEKREPMKVGISGADPAYAILAHQNRGVQVVEQVPAHVGQLLHDLCQYRPMARRRYEHVKCRSFEQRREKPPGLCRCPRRRGRTRVGGDPQELVTDAPGQIRRRWIIAGLQGHAVDMGRDTANLRRLRRSGHWCRRPALIPRREAGRARRGWRCQP